MIALIVTLYLIGLVIQISALCIDIDSGGDEEGFVFAALFWPLDWIRHIYRSFKRWLHR
jgi:hypothetical protein